MPNDTQCSVEQIAMWIQIYAYPGTIGYTESIKTRANAFDIIYQCYRKKLYTYLLFMSGTEELANQIFQGIWEDIINNRDKLAKQANKGTLNFGVCIFTIARTTLLKSLELKSLDLNQLNALPASILSFASAIIQLPLHERDTYLLRRFGLSLADIAQVQQSSDCDQNQSPSSDIPVSEVRSLLMSVMQNLQSILDKL